MIQFINPAKSLTIHAVMSEKFEFSCYDNDVSRVRPKRNERAARCRSKPICYEIISKQLAMIRSTVDLRYFPCGHANIH